MTKNLFYDCIMSKLEEVVKLEDENIDKAANMISDCIKSGGLLQAFGSGHSYANAIEICGRAGGLIPSKILDEPSHGMYEMIEGVGTQFALVSDFRANDVFVIISNSGRNPMSIELAAAAQKRGTKIIVLTALECSKKLTSRHSSGQMLYQFADVILDNHGVYGDAAIELPGLPIKTGGTSSIIGSMLLDEMMVRAIQIMIDEGYVPPIFQSANIDGGPEYNQKLLDMYSDRLYRR